MSRSSNKPAAKPTAADKPADAPVEKAQDTDPTKDQGTAGPELVLPADVNEGIDLLVSLLEGTYKEADINAILGERFKPEVEAASAQTTAEKLLDGPAAFELAFPLDVLAEDSVAGRGLIQAALNDRKAPEGIDFPDFLIGFEFNQEVLDRYILGATTKEIELETVELVIADPATDPVLKTLNFSRFLQGLSDTHFYLRFL